MKTNYLTIFKGGGIFLFLLLHPLLVKAGMVEQGKAEKVACNFMKRSFGRTDGVVDVVKFDSFDVTTMYAFNFKDGGYVLTSGSKLSDPILAYSETGKFLSEKEIDNENLLDFLSACKYEVVMREEKSVRSLNAESAQKWDIWLDDEYYSPAYDPENQIAEVPNLLYDPKEEANIEWHQEGCKGKNTTEANLLGVSYNIMMPSVGNCEHAVAGCVPTALAQVMRKWRWPNSVSYPYKGRLYESTYTWDSMPAILTENSTKRNAIEISTLMRDCGYMLEANYGCYGTSAYDEKIWEKMIKTRLIGYNAYGNIFTEEFSERYNRPEILTYSMVEWLSIVKSELIAGRPVILGSSGDLFRHCLVISGFQKRNDGYYFYANFGWGGNSDGYYNIDFTSNAFIKEEKKCALIGLSPIKGNENHEHDINAVCTQATIGDAGKLSFYAQNANSYILKIKYKEKIVRGYGSSDGKRFCQYGNDRDIILERVHGNVFNDGIISVWYNKDVKLENKYTTYCEEISSPTMYEITFMNNYGQIVTYEGTFEAEDKESTSVENNTAENIILICPNSTSNTLCVRSIQKGIERVAVYNVLGNVIKSIDVNKATNVEIDMNDLASGCYIISATTENSRTVKQIIKK